VHVLAQRTVSVYLYHVPMLQGLITLLSFPPGSATGRMALFYWPK
jgi:hypothetical protein